MSNQAQVTWTGRSHCQEDGEIQLKEAKNPTTAATATKPRFHGMVHPMTLHEEVNHRKMTRANCCSSSRKQTQMGKVICHMLHNKSAVPGFETGSSNPRAHEHVQRRCIHSSSSLPNNFSACSSNPTTPLLYLHRSSIFI